jgi:hypothetical protein
VGFAVDNEALVQLFPCQFIPETSTLTDHMELTQWPLSDKKDDD